MHTIKEISFHDLAIRSLSLDLENGNFSMIIYKFIEDTDDITELKLVFYNVLDFYLEKLSTIEIDEIYDCDMSKSGERNIIEFELLHSHSSISAKMSFSYDRAEVIGEWNSAWNMYPPRTI